MVMKTESTNDNMSTMTIWISMKVECQAFTATSLLQWLSSHTQYYYSLSSSAANQTHLFYLNYGDEAHSVT